MNTIKSHKTVLAFMLKTVFILLLPMVVMANNEELLLNEVATTSTQFIELRKPTDVPIVDLAKYGIVIAEKVKTKGAKKRGEIKIKAVLGLPLESRQVTSFEVIHFGNLLNHPNVMGSAPPNNPRWRIFDGSNENNWLEVQPNNFLAVFLTKSDQSILDVIKIPIQGRAKDLYITDDIRTYLQSSVVDYVVIRKANGPSDDAKINEIIEEKSPQSERTPAALYEFLTEFTGNPPASLSRCAEFKGFHLRGFLNTKRTPGMVNDCDAYQPKFITETQIQKSNLMEVDSCRDELYKSDEEEGESSMQWESCEVYDDKGDADTECKRVSVATGLDEQGSNNVIKKNLDKSIEKVCVTESWLSQRKAEVALEVGRVLEMKRKLQNIPDFDDRPWTKGHEDFDSWIPLINEHQSAIMPLDLIRRMRAWFKYNPNIIRPAESTYCCWQCSEVGHKAPVRNRTPSKLSNKQGVLEPTMARNRIVINEHARGITHRRTMEELAKQYLENSDESLAKIIETMFNVNDPTEFHLHLTYLERRTKQAHENHRQFMDFFLMYHKTLKIAEHCKSRDAAMRTGLAIGNEMHQKMRDFWNKLKNGQEVSRPLAIIADSSSDCSNLHILSVLIQTFEESKRIVVYFYKAIQLGPDSTGLAQAEAIYKAFDEDGILPFIRKNVVAIVTDGANNMIGIHNGMTAHLRRMLDKPKIISHHCMAHRLELAFGHPMKDYQVFEDLEKDTNKIYAFFSKSDRRYALMDKFLKEKQKTTIRFQHIYKVRWVKSHLDITTKIFERHKDIVQGLEYIINVELPRGKAGNATAYAAEELVTYLTDRNAISTIVFNLDIQERFSTESLMFQKTLSSLIGQVEREQILVTDLESLKNGEGKQFNEFIKSCKCGQIKANLANCNNLNQYETAKYVYYQDIELYKGSDYLYPKLSTFKDDYVDQIREELVGFFPKYGNEQKARVPTNIFTPLNQALWPDDKNKIQMYEPGSIQEIAKIFDVTYTATLQEEFDKLVKTILEEATISDQSSIDPGDLSDPLVVDELIEHENKRLKLQQRLIIQQQEHFFCDFKNSDPVLFWEVVLRKFPTSPPLQRLIKSSIIIPLGSADAERSFSALNIIKSKHKNRMKLEQINSDMVININGPKMSWFVPKNYLDAYTRRHDKCDVELNDSRAKKKIEESDKMEAEQRGMHFFSGKTCLL